MQERIPDHSPSDAEKRQPLEDEPEVHEPLQRPEGGNVEPYAEADARYRYRNKDPAKRDAPILLSWRIGLFLLTSTFLQNLTYNLSSMGLTEAYSWKTQQFNKFYSLVYYMLYLGPVFGFTMDIFRVWGERYRPSIIAGCVVNLICCFVFFGKTEAVLASPYGTIMVSWLTQIAIMYIYNPMNVVTIRYGNRCFFNSLSYEYDRLNEKLGFKTKRTDEEKKHIRSVESTARVGTLMSQLMVWRYMGSFLYSIFNNFARGRNAATPHVKTRWYVFMAAVGSCILILQVLFLMKRKYFLDYTEKEAKAPICTKIVRDAFKVKRATLGRTHKPIGSNFMFILCFIFVYFMIPDVLYNTRFTANYIFYASFGARWKQTFSILSSLGAVIGALAYALWMILAYVFENRRHRRRLNAMKNQTRALKGRNPNNNREPANEGSGHDSDSDDDVDHEDNLRLVDKPYFYSPWQAGTFVVVFAGCTAWAFGTFFHMFGEMGRHNPNFNFHVFLLFETLVVNACLAFALLPTLTLLAIHCPFNYEAASFALYSVATSGGGVISSLATTSVGTYLGFDSTAYTLAGLTSYWKMCLLCIFFQFFPLLIAPALPKCRADIRVNKEDIEDWKVSIDERPATVRSHDVNLQEEEEPQEPVRTPSRESDTVERKKVEQDE